MAGMAIPMAGGPGALVETLPPRVWWVQTGTTTEQRPISFNSGQDVVVRYRKAGAASGVQETFVLSAIELDLTKQFNETVVPGSVRFQFGGSTFQATAGAIYRDPSPATGAGTLAGTLDPTTGRVALTNWLTGANSVTLQSLTTEIGGQPVDEVMFRTPASPLKPGVLQLRWQLTDGTVKTKTPPTNGVVEDADGIVLVDWDRGVVYARFGRWRIDGTLTPEEKLEPWYDPLLIANIGGVAMIWQPEMVYADSIVYNAVATTMLPPDSTLLGLDAARLPPDGKALLFQSGMLCLTHHTAALAPQSLSAGQVINCGRTRLYRVVIDDANGERLPADLYTVGRELGTVTMADPLDLTGYTGPYTLRHTIADLSRVRDTDINGSVTMLRALSHDFPLGAYCSGLLYAGTLQARVSDVFEQSTWTGVWSDTRIGDQPLASYNLAAFPIVVTNKGAYKDRMLVKFTSATAFQVIGENLGLVGIGDINTDCAPINPLTGEPYCTIDYRGWGGGWATGNCLRFNLHAASYPVDLVRAVQPSDPTGQSDCVELLLVGNVDA